MAAIGDQDTITQCFQHRLPNLENHVLVVHQKDRPFAVLDLVQFRSRTFFHGRLFRCGQVNVEGGALSFFSGDIDEATVVFDDAVDRCKTQPRAFSHVLCREKGDEDLLTGRGIHTHPGIGHRNLYVSSRCTRERSTVFCVESDVLGLDVEVPTVRHGLPGVHIEIEKCLPYLSLVTFHGPQVFMVLSVNSNLPLGAAKHSVLVFDEGVKVNGPDLVLAAARKPQQFPGQLHGILYVLFNAFQMLVVGMGRVLVHHHHGGSTLNPHQNIVEIVCNASGQCPDGFHLLGLDQFCLKILPLLLSLLSLGDVLHHRQRADNTAVVAPQRSVGPTADDGVAVFCGVLIYAVCRDVPFQQACPHVVNRRLDLPGNDHTVGMPSYRFLRGIAEYAFRGRVPIDNLEVTIPQDEANRHPFDLEAQPFFTLL